MSFVYNGIIVKKINKDIQNDILKNIIEFQKNINIDYHPNSENKVIDIVHPSLYPLLKKIKASSTNIKSSSIKVDFWKRPYEDASFQWLPSEFEIDKNGKCKIKSYINNVPIENVKLYESIEKLFEFVLPEFENVWSYINSIKLYDEGDWGVCSNEKHKKNAYKYLDLKNRNLQVIFKLVKINLKNNEDLIGAWHIEGMPHEHIVATATCTIEQSSNFSAELNFKRIYSLEEAYKILTTTHQDPYFDLYNLLQFTHVPLGKQQIKKGDIVVFPNSHIHKIDMKSTSKGINERIIAVFWLIDPTVKIESTKNIKQQKYDIKIAHKNRLELMKERTFHKQTLNQRDLNLCEH
jgi:hypothetical protein